MTRSFATALRCCAAGAALVALSPAARADKTHPVIGYTVYDMSSFISLGKRGVEKIADTDGATLLWNSANSDVNTQVSQIQQFINRKVDAIVIAAVNSSTLGPQVAAAKAAGIPVILTNLTANPDVMKEAVSYVGPDDVKAGENEATHAIAAIGGKGGVVVLEGPLGQSGEIDRTQGIKNVLAKNPGVTLLAMQPANWKRDEAYKVTQDFLSRYGTQIKAIIPENDDMAIGAGQALKEKGLAGKLPVVGVDGIKDGMRAIRSGDMIETNLQDALLELGEAMQVAVDQVQGRPVPKLAMIIMPQLTKDNVAHYYDQMYARPAVFISGLPDLVKKDLKSGDYAAQ